MKLSVATTLLAQCVPALTQTLLLQDLSGSTADQMVVQTRLEQVQQASRGRSTNHLFHKVKRGTRHAKQRVLSKVQGILKNGSPPRQSSLKGRRLQCDPSSTDADTGILSCGHHGLYCKESRASNRGGFCRVVPPTSQGTTADRGRSPAQIIIEKGFVTSTYPNVPGVEKAPPTWLPCDPNTPDLGILSCGPGEFCRQDGNSDMGGICVLPTPAASRKLYTVDDDLQLCDPSSTHYLPFCDCSGVDTTTGTGSITCLQSDYALCTGVLADISATYSFTSRNLTSQAICYAITVPYYQKVCFISNYLNGANVRDSCSVEFNGQECSSCFTTDSFYYFDCTAINPNWVGSDLPDLLLMIDQCYGGGNYLACVPCTKGTTIPAANYGVNVTIPGYGPLSCEALAYVTANGFIPYAYCSLLAGIAQTSCCVPVSTESTITPAPSSANVPGGGGEPATAPDGGEPVAAQDGGEPVTAPDGAESAPSSDDGSSAAFPLPVLDRGVVWSVIVSTLVHIFVQ